MNEDTFHAGKWPKMNGRGHYGRVPARYDYTTLFQDYFPRCSIQSRPFSISIFIMDIS